MADTLKNTLGKAENLLSSDAKVSDLISAENADFQPMKLWYGSHAQPKEHSQDNDEQLSQEFVDAATDDQQASGPPPISALINDLLPNGAGTTIAILDSGINTTHTAFAQRISPESKSFVSDSIEDVLGHGTQCAGLACGSEDIIAIGNHQLPFQGIAPEAKVMVCKVVPDGTGLASTDAVIQALEHILEYNRTCSTHYDRVSVVSISFGMPTFDYFLSKKIQEVIYNDIIVVCAALNDGRKYKQSIAYPARLGHVLCIGSCNSNGGHSSFSPRGRELDFLAPGEDIWAPTIGGPRMYASVTGTSFAAPLVAGIVCQIVQDLRDQQPLLIDQLHNVWGMREILKHMSTIQGVHHQDEGFGILRPLEYFEKTRNEKNSVLSKIL